MEKNLHKMFKMNNKRTTKIEIYQKVRTLAKIKKHLVKIQNLPKKMKHLNQNLKKDLKNQIILV